MTNEQAIDILDSLVGMLSINNVPADEALKMGISALEKQVPKKPTTDGVSVIEYCPSCKKQLRTCVNVEDTKYLNGTYTRISLHPAYCEHCGQAIEWDESL